MDSILQGQWDNGLLPHIIFNPKAKGYFPDFKYWKTDEYSPTGTLTSGIIQPPVHAIAALEYFDHSHDKKTTKLVPKIKKIPPISLRKPRS